MLWKMLLTLAVVAIAWRALTPRQAGARRRIGPPDAPVRDLIACARCGAYRTAGSPCACAEGGA